MKNVLKYLLLALIAVSQLFACGGSDDEKTPADNFDVQFTVPGSVDVTEGGECTFAVSGGGKSPLTTDTFILESDAGISYVCPIVNTSSDSFTVRLADGCETGYYKVFVKRDARKKSFGRIYINIVEDIDFKPDAGTTVYGIVSSAGVGVENVVVSDGAEVTVTNEKGIYQLKSAKKWGYVFISVPSGYEVPSVGVLPQFHRALKNSADVVERADFKLEKVDGQDSYKIFMLGDMHLANRTGDLGQFAQFTSDLTDYMTRHKGEKMYALTLGDMTWDLYWYSNSYYFPQYLNTVNSQIKNLQIFHTMGNHDNDFQTRSDYDAAVKYVDQICPTYYSFNIGKVHYVVLDDMLYHGRNKYDRIIAPEQLAWLYKDLRALDPEIRQLVVACHVPLVANNGAWDDIWYNLKNKDELFVLLQDYDVTIMTGDWHTEGTTRVSDRIVEYVHPAVTGNWWYRQGICCNGYPAAFTEYVFRGDRLESRSLIDWANGNSKRQYRVYNKGVTSNTGIASSSALDPAGGAPSVLVFFWGVAPNWTFVCRENGELTYGRGQLVQRYDPLARSLVEEGIIPYERYTWLKQKPVRLYLYTPKDPGAEIEIVGTDHIRNRDFRVVTRIER